jgi:hypothetical protein
MTNQLGDYYRIQCKMKLKTHLDVARLVGYRNTRNGVQRLMLFEQYGVIKQSLLVKVAEVLDMDWELVEELSALDEQAKVAETEHHKE